MIIDFHTHNRLPDQANMASMLSRATRLGIDRVCNLGDVLKYGYFPSEEEVRKINDRSIALAEQYGDRIFSCCFLNMGNSTAFSLAEMERCLLHEGKNFIGIKLEIGLNCRDRKFDPVMRRAAELNALVIQHSWYKSKGRDYPEESEPHDIADLARRFPDVTIICPHLAGIGHRGILDFVLYPNIIVDTSGGQPIAGLVEYAVEKLGAERVIFGSDTYGNTGRDPACQLGRVMGADISDRDKELILGGNARRILKI